MTKLAIIIPYYKLAFFKEALLSIKNQTDSRYRLYIGNDNSPNDPDEIINEIFGDSEIVSYKKFDDNLGALQLTQQWQRCIDMSQEPYVWLFSDDDIMPPDSVERFYKFIEAEPKADLVRFDLHIIDDKGLVISSISSYPLHETAAEFTKRRMRGQCISAACEYIFTKAVYLRHGGFENFPVGWASDDATWIKFGTQTGIYTIPGQPVLWRFGGVSISSDTKNKAEKTKAALMFVKFVRDKGYADKQLQLYWLFLQLRVLKYPIALRVKFFLNLISIKMFSFIDIVKFAGNLIVQSI